MVATVLVIALGLVMTGFVYVLLRRRDQTARASRTFWLMMVGMSVVGGVAAGSFAAGRPAIGIGLLVAIFVLPEFVLMPMRIRRSRAAAEKAREARAARQAHDTRKRSGS
jgi:hypothetical protein